MISLTPVIDFLRPAPDGFALPWFRQVAGAAEYAQIRPEALPLPACWIVRRADNDEQADPEGLAANLTLSFTAVIAVENARVHYHGDTDDMLLAYRHAVRRRLQGYEIEPDIRPIQFAGGTVLEYTDGDLYWADTYQFDALITNYLDDPGPFSALVFTGANL
ncbi:MAG: hypothetical protein CTY21_11690 [Methylomonas sp.]|nr:MAG: hypothetical protein CTY21_11690 [Methylomonas sp.]